MNIKRILLTGLVAVILCTISTRPSAQTSDEGNTWLDVLLMAEQWSVRCPVNYHDMRTIRYGINAAKNNDAEISAVLRDTANSIEVRTKTVNEIMYRRRSKAAGAVASAACSPTHPAFQAVGYTFAPSFALMIEGVNTEPFLSDLPSGQRKAYDQMTKGFELWLGSKWITFTNEAKQTLAETRNEWTAESMWSALEVYVKDLNWQNRLYEKGYSFQPGDDLGLKLKARSVATNRDDFPALFSHRGDRRIALGSETVDVYEAQGRMDDGRIVIMIANHSQSENLDPLHATILVQSYASSTAWSRYTWRASATSFASEQLDAATCPADYCFVFPRSASDAIESNFESANFEHDLFAYELVLGSIDDFPPPSGEEAYLRRKFTPFGFD